MGKDAGEFLDTAYPLGSLGPEDLREWIDPGGADADVVHRDARLARLLDRVRRVSPGVAAFVALVRDQAVAEWDMLVVGMGAVGPHVSEPVEYRLVEKVAAVGIMVAFEKAMVWQVVHVCVDTCTERWRIAKRVIVVTSACVLAISG